VPVNNTEDGEYMQGRYVYLMLSGFLLGDTVTKFVREHVLQKMRRELAREGDRRAQESARFSMKHGKNHFINTAQILIIPHV